MRTFVAIEVSNHEAVQNMLGFQKAFLETGISAKPVEANHLHFTLMFLGEINNAMLESIKSKLSDIKFEPIYVTYMGVGVFPNPKSVRVIWIGVDNDSASKLINLVKEVESRLNILGFKNDKPFKPHLTLFRIKYKIRNFDAIMNFKDKKFGTDTLSTIKIKKSELTPSGPIYRDLFSVGSK
ncbi:MAG: RNA 2',3'-cyclic phosphodiesterase [Thaumarchaeota archaeon]|nr:RNA 2',3'-cyclic phosphodiesterase [Nitrososphaerota archaeon]|tara:strand:- start:21 stop:566 length:546 start_codon:yes stop_codon:yes gene_type:complete